MKKRLFAVACIVALLAVLCLGIVGCDKTPADQDDTENYQLNIIDDNYRNWYEIFVYSFFDTNNDGIGDLKGVTQKLDYVKDMGFNGIWLMPIHPSPTYHKYDVKDYYAIDDVYGTLEDFDTLIEQAHARGIKVIIDLVFNHTSSEHPWFLQACDYIRKNGKPGGQYGDFYNFNTKELSGYSKVSGTNYYYEARFWSGMPDLNLNSQSVKSEMTKIMKYWLEDHNVDGFRLDAVTSYYTGNLDKNVSFLSWLNTTAKSIKSDCYIVGEAWEGNDVQINNYYKSGCDGFFLFTGATGTGKIASFVKQQNATGFASWVDELQSTYTTGILAPFLGNHDTMRPGSFMPDELSLKMAAGLLSVMNGSVFVYYGEEIGMISKEGNSSDPHKRIAMNWDEGVYPGWCYTTPEKIKIDSSYYAYPSVKEQQEDKNSVLSYYKKAMLLRNCYPSIARGTIEVIDTDAEDTVCVLKKTYLDETITIVINLSRSSDESVTLGNMTMVGYLTAKENTKPVFDKNNGVATLPPCSIAIYKNSADLNK